MAVNNPMRLAGSELRKMTDSELENLTKNFRRAYARRLVTSNYPGQFQGNGLNLNTSFFRHICPGKVWGALANERTISNHTHNVVGNMTTTVREIATNTRVNNDDGGAGGVDANDYPSYPSYADMPIVNSDTTYFLQYMPHTAQGYLKPDNNIKRTFSYLTTRGSTSSPSADIGPECDDTNIIETIFKQVNYEILNGDNIGLQKIASSWPGQGWWQNTSYYNYRDYRATGQGYWQKGQRATVATYYLYTYAGSDDTGSGTAAGTFDPSQTNVPIQYRHYRTDMQTGSAIRTTGNNIDDYYLEGTYRGTIYIKSQDTYGTPKWSTDNGTYTNLSLNTTQLFDQYMGSTAGLTDAHGTKTVSSIFYPTGSSSGGYCRVWLNVPLEKTPARENADNQYRSGMGPNGEYNTTNVYKFTYDPAIQPSYFSGPRRVDGFASAADHDEVLQANVRRLSLIYNVLMPLYETRGHQEDPNYIRYQLTEDNPSSWESTSQKNCGYMYDTRDTLDATSQYLQDGTYYRTRYAYPWSWYGYEIATTKYLKAYSQIGVR